MNVNVKSQYMGWMNMLILSVESSAKSASVCLYDKKIVAEYYINTEFTHSQTLTVLIESMLKVTGINIKDVDCFAVNNGPGSFTGVRIGVSAVKGMAYALDKPCVAISTLESMAYNFISDNALICACMDARRNQLYNALFDVNSGQVNRIFEDRAISINDLYNEISKIKNKDIIIVGDGAELFFDSIENTNKNIILAPDNLRFQRASSTAMCAYRKIISDQVLNAKTLLPSYLRLSQAERERNKNKS